jgi:hypothetical protein
MADYNGFYADPEVAELPYNHHNLNSIGIGRSKLAYHFGESGSGSYPSGGYPSGVAALGVPVIEIAAGGYAVMYVALEAGQSVSAPVFASPFGKCGLRLIDRIGPVLATDYSADSDEWETLVVTLPSGYSAGIYLVELANFAIQDEDDARAFFGPVEVI